MINPYNYIEIWKPIILNDVKPGLYEVSSFGRVKNNKGIILKPIIINTGYYIYRLFTGNKDRKYTQYLAHRLVLLTFNPIENPYEMTVDHLDGKKWHNTWYNLEWVTQSENNNRSRINNFNKNYGVNHYKSLLTETQVNTICQLLEKGYKYIDIIKIIGLDVNNENNLDIIGNIKRHITYKNISCNYNF